VKKSILFQFLFKSEGNRHATCDMGVEALSLERPKALMATRMIRGVWFSAAIDQSQRVLACSFDEEERNKAERKLLEHLGEYDVVEASSLHGLLGDLLSSLSAVYEGKGCVEAYEFSFEGLGEFTQRVLLATRAIPKGKVAFYSMIARVVGNERASRAVGNAEAANPFALIIPCHRVVRSNREVGGYGGGSEVKRRLLKREGVEFEGRLISPKSLWKGP